jgi:hypothetical protein
MSATRKTTADCEDLLANLGKKGKFRVWKSDTPMPKTGGYFFIEGAFGKLRVFYQYRKTSAVKEISPRLTTGQLHTWLREFGTMGFKNFLKYKMRD